MPSDPPRPGWWRFPTPSCMVLVLILSFLPWLEIGCESKADLGNPLGGMGGGQLKITPPGLGGGKPMILAEQSGFQIATGNHTTKNPLEDTFGGGLGGNVGAPGAMGAAGGGKQDIAAAPLIWLFFLGVVASIAGGLALPPSRLRAIVVGSSIGIAVLVLLVQWLILGFPAAKKIGEDPMGNAALGGPEQVTFFVRYTPFYWMTLVLLVGGLVLLAVEERLAPKKEAAEPVLEVDEGEPPPRETGFRP